MKLLLLLTLGLFIPKNPIYSQNEPVNTSLNELQGQTLDHSAFTMFSELEKNGINTTEIAVEIGINDIEKLKSFDFSPYRVFNKSQKIQIENGPIIEIYSVEKMVSMGFVYENAYILSKKNVDNTSVTHEIIPLVNIGYGITSAEILH